MVWSNLPKTNDLIDEGLENGVDLAFGAGLQDSELRALRARPLPARLV